MRTPLSTVGAIALLLFPLTASAAPPDCGATLYDCAMGHVGRREFAEAIRYLEAQLAAVPRDLKALNLLGIALTGAGRKEDASARFRAALAIDPAFVPARKNLAVNAYDAGRYTEARGQFEKVLEAAPADEIAHLYLGEIHYRAKRSPAAVDHYGRSGTRYTLHPLATLHYGRALLDVGRTKDAVAVLAQIPDADGASLFEGGVALGTARAHVEAARLFARARRTYKEPYAAAFNEALMHVEAGRFDSALRVVQELMAAGQAPAEVYSLASRAHLGAGQVQEAYDALRTATRLAPDDPDHYVDLATIAVDHENFDLGLEIVDVGLRHLPDAWRLHLQRGVLLALKGEMEAAEKAFEEARRHAPDPAVPYAALAMTWMQSGQTEKAVEVLRRELPRPKDHVIPYIFAVALLRSGLDATSPAATEAVDALEASIRANPTFAPSRAELGKLLLKRGEVDLAVKELEKAAALDPGNTPALYALSQAYLKKGDRPRAQELLARVSKLNAQERGDDPDRELRRAVVRIVREGTAPSRKPAAEN